MCPTFDKPEHLTDIVEADETFFSNHTREKRTYHAQLASKVEKPINEVYLQSRFLPLLCVIVAVLLLKLYCPT